MAEATDLRSVKCQFDPDDGYSMPRRRRKYTPCYNSGTITHTQYAAAVTAFKSLVMDLVRKVCEDCAQSYRKQAKYWEEIAP